MILPALIIFVGGRSSSDKLESLPELMGIGSSMDQDADAFIVSLFRNVQTIVGLHSRQETSGKSVKSAGDLSCCVSVIVGLTVSIIMLVIVSGEEVVVPVTISEG
ncbi:hypothetical protein L873DRAFT_246679 [Choiromyces venosus 120613-1]|uniref:Uncharacterized protein n=1 Tax=Choiromyces venosus 120613-1 TaxID=1336337 RepID=A0A3N4J481_9PEZI|nr:hypothetical protein L873DRAFT_246679 [Choiromyces venosus 120613-1]